MRRQFTSALASIRSCAIYTLTHTSVSDWLDCGNDDHGAYVSVPIEACVMQRRPAHDVDSCHLGLRVDGWVVQQLAHGVEVARVRRRDERCRVGLGVGRTREALGVLADLHRLRDHAAQRQRRLGWADSKAGGRRRGRYHRRGRAAVVGSIGARLEWRRASSIRQDRLGRNLLSLMQLLVMLVVVLVGARGRGWRRW